MGVPGRKSYTDELKIAQRYADLSEDFFRILKRNLNGKNEANQKWAVEQLSKAFVKMIPQDHSTGGQPIQIVFDNAFRK